jgi:hypothetical protein
MQAVIKTIADKHWQVAQSSGKVLSESTLKYSAPDQDGRTRSMEARSRELPKICAMLDLNPATLEPIDQPNDKHDKQQD